MHYICAKVSLDAQDTKVYNALRTRLRTARPTLQLPGTATPGAPQPALDVPAEASEDAMDAAGTEASGGGVSEGEPMVE